MSLVNKAKTLRALNKCTTISGRGGEAGYDKYRTGLNCYFISTVFESSVLRVRNLDVYKFKNSMRKLR